MASPHQQRPGLYESAPPDTHHSAFRRSFTYGVVGANAVVFLAWQGLSPRFMRDNFTLRHRNLQQGRWWTLLTSALSHRALDHLVANLVSLDAYGALALGSALAGSCALLADWRRKGVWLAAAHGASGMVCGVGMAVTLMRPEKLVRLMFFPRPLPMWAVTAGYFALDCWNLDKVYSRVGHAGHIGGALFGAAYYYLRLRNLPIR